MDNLPPVDEVFGQQTEQYHGQNDWSPPFAAFESGNGTEGTRVESAVDVVPTRSGAKQGRQKKNSHAKQGRQKRISHRGCSFTKDEDKLICSAFLNISKDPITGVTKGGYYKRMHRYFCKHRSGGPSRSQLAVQHRWQIIQKGVNKFCTYKSEVDKRNESGRSEQDRIEEAVKMYEKNEPFKFIHCWKLLCKEAKWSDRMVELNRLSRTMKPVPTSQASSENGDDRVDRPESDDRVAKWSDRMLEINRQSPTTKSVPTSQASSENDNDRVGRPEGRDHVAKWSDQMLELNRPSSATKYVPTSQASSENGNDRVDRPEGSNRVAKWNDQMLEHNRLSPTTKSVPTPQASSENGNDHVDRPEGRDSAKKRKTNGGDAASSSTAVDVLQQIHESTGKTEDRQEQQMQEILTMKGDKLKLSEKMFDLQKQYIEQRSRLREEQLILTKKDIEVRAKQSEAQLLMAELGIMGADLDKLTPPVRAYYIGMQRQIMERRGISIPLTFDE